MNTFNIISALLLALSFEAKYVTTKNVIATKEALLVKSSYAGCCGHSGANCQSCHMDVGSSLKVGNYHYFGSVLLQFDLPQEPVSCSLQLPKEGVQVLGSGVVTARLANTTKVDFDTITWATAPPQGPKIGTVDFQAAQPIDLTDYCQQFAGSSLFVYLTHSNIPQSVEFPSSNSKSLNPIALEIQH